MDVPFNRTECLFWGGGGGAQKFTIFNLGPNGGGGGIKVPAAN